MFLPVLRKELAIQKKIVLSPGPGIHNNESIQAMWCLHSKLVYSSLSHIYIHFRGLHIIQRQSPKNNPRLLFFYYFILVSPIEEEIKA